MPHTIELWFFRVTDGAGRRFVPRYRMTFEEARARYVTAEPVPNSREVRVIDENDRGHGALGRRAWLSARATTAARG